MTITTPEQMREAAAKCCDINNISPNFSAPAQSISTAMAIAAAIRAIPIASQPATDWTACAADMLRVWDTWFGGSAGGDDAAARKLSIASAFAAQAFEHAASSGITADGAPAALLRAFLLALIDKLHPDLDYLRADPASGEKARAERGAVAPQVVAAPQPVAVTVTQEDWDAAARAIGTDVYDLKAALIPQPADPQQPVVVTVKPLVDRFDVRLDVDGNTATAMMDQSPDGYWVRISDYEALAALTIQPADPLSDPRVVALVGAVTLMGRFFQEVMPKMNVADSALDANDFYVWNMTGVATNAALRAIGGEA